MRLLLFFLLLANFCFSLYQDPPVSEVTSHNVLRADELADSFNQTIAENDSIYISWYGKPLAVNASMEIAGLTLLVDNATTAGENVRVIIAHGGRMDHILRKGSMSLRCDKAFFQSYGDHPECDFDGDGCSEYEDSAEIFYTMEINFTLGNASEVGKADETSVNILGNLFKNALTNRVSFPDGIEDAVADSSGNENLEMMFNGTATFVYVIDNRYSGGLSCISSKQVVSRTLYFSDNASYPAEGENKFIFTTSPLLNEQWFRNNRFDNLVLSQSRIYKAEVFLNGEKEKNFTLYEFNVTEESFGLQGIVSLPVDNSSFAGRINATPVWLEEETHTYGFIYQFEYGYGEDMGENELRLDVHDVFGREESAEQKILSRQLSFAGNMTETGEEYDPSTTRRSAAFEMDELRLLELGIGMIGLLVVLLLIYRIRF